jgi:cytochrome b561
MRYDSVAVALHWAIALLVIAQFVLGWWMLSLPEEGGVQRDWFNLHKSLGMTLGLLVLLRLGWRAKHPAPPFPPALPAWQRLAAHITHGGLYVCLVLLPLTGYLGSSFSGYPVRYFGYALPAWGWNWPAVKAPLAGVHLALTWILVALVLVHVAAALAHLARRDGVFQRMWPRWRNA